MSSRLRLPELAPNLIRPIGPPPPGPPVAETGPIVRERWALGVSASNRPVRLAPNHLAPNHLAPGGLPGQRLALN